MENLVESNERTLIMFDSICSGLAACLSLVHADIRQMTEHRNKLAQLEHQHIQAKLIPAQELASAVETNTTTTNDISSRHRTKKNHNHNQDHTATPEDPLAGLKQLDKRLADSFSQALSLNDDLHKSSITVKQQASQSKPTIFQVLLGKSHRSSNNGPSNRKNSKNKDGAEPRPAAARHLTDNTVIIDDINRQTRLAMQYAKQLEANLFIVEDLRSRYEMHLKMGLVVKSVSRAYLANTNNNKSNNSSSPNTLSKRQHSSSFTVNDSMSLSSLNLSTWSSSRSRSNLHASSSSLKKIQEQSIE